MSPLRPTPSAAAAAAVAARRYARRVLLLLMLAYTFNAADRSLVSVIGQSMKGDLKLSDTQLGLLAGTAFAALYALSGIPLARLAERFSRVAILSGALALWSALTALSAATGSFVQLIAVRVGVGVAEAGCSPCAHSLISDYYASPRRSSALAVYSCGLSLGYLFVSVLGGYVTAHYGWRAACVAVGLPGIILALLIRCLVSEPRRGQSEGASGAPAARGTKRVRAPFALGSERAELTAAARSLFLSWPAANMILGITLASFASYGSFAFLPAYFHRAFALDYATIGVALGLAGSVPVALGTLAGGFVTDALGRRHGRWYALVPAAGLLIATPFYLAALQQRDWINAVVLLAIPGFFQYVLLGPTFGVIQNVVAIGHRATATALVFLCLNVLALGGGSLFTGWLIDHLAAAQFSYPGVGAFQVACPGGSAPAGAPPGLKAACDATLARASREGIFVTLTLYGWAALHYLMAARGLEALLHAAARRNAAAAASA